MYWVVVASVVSALAGLGVYIYYQRKGQFEDQETIKYQLFREDNPDN